MKLLSATATLTEVETRELLVVVTTDEKRYAVSRAVFRQSELIRDLLEEAEEGVVEIPLEMDSNTLQRVYEYADHHQFDVTPPRPLERPLKGEIKTYLDVWDWKYVEDSLFQGDATKCNDHLFAVMKAATFLGIAPLRELCCAVIASVLQTKSEEEILKMFGIQGFSENEEQQILKEFPWLQE